MANLKIRDGDGVEKFVKSLGTGTITDPLIRENRTEIIALPPVPAGNNLIGKIEVINFPIQSALPAGTNTIGKVGIAGDIAIASLPPIPPGTNTIGKVEVTTLPNISLATNTQVGVTNFPSGFAVNGSLPTGINNIGKVDIASFPINLIDANALKVSQKPLSDATDSVSAKQSGAWQVSLATSTSSIGKVEVTTLPAINLALNSQVGVTNFPSGFSILASLPTGTNNIGKVDVATLPSVNLAANTQVALSAGINSIGKVEVTAIPAVGVSNLPALPAGTNNIGKVDINTLPSVNLAANSQIGVANFPSGFAVNSPLPAGTNNIGKVDIGSFPTNLVDTNRLKIVQVETVNPTFITVSLATLNYEYAANINNAKCFSFRVISGSANIRYAYETGKVVNSIIPIYPLENGVEESENFAGARFTGTIYLARDGAGNDAANTVVVFKVWS